MVADCVRVLKSHVPMISTTGVHSGVSGTCDLNN